MILLNKTILLQITFFFLAGGLSVMSVPLEHSSEDLIKNDPLEPSVIILSHLSRLPENELLQIKIAALSGDASSAFRIIRHYTDTSEIIKWLIIGTENGHLEMQLGLGNLLLNVRRDFESNNRGIFWLHQLAIVNYRNAEAWLNRFGISIEEAQPPDDSLFYNEYTELNSSMLEQYKEGALRGNKRAAWILGKYYSEIQSNNDLSEYWHRIGAQNGNPESQYILGQILINKENNFDQIRGEFWLRQAAKQER